MRSPTFLSILVIFTFYSTEAKHSTVLPVCPDCVSTLDDTVVTVARKYLTANPPGPEDGVCLSGQKWIYFGKDHGFKNNACCCIPVPTYPPIDCGHKSDSPECPRAIPLGFDEPFGHYNERVGRTVIDAPTNGCCPKGYFKWILDPFFTGAAKEICTCINLYDNAKWNVRWRSL